MLINCEKKCDDKQEISVGRFRFAHVWFHTYFKTFYFSFDKVNIIIFYTAK